MTELLVGDQCQARAGEVTGAQSTEAPQRSEIPRISVAPGQEWNQRTGWTSPESSGLRGRSPAP